MYCIKKEKSVCIRSMFSLFWFMVYEEPASDLRHLFLYEIKKKVHLTPSDISSRKNKNEKDDRFFFIFFSGNLFRHFLPYRNHQFVLSILKVDTLFCQFKVHRISSGFSSRLNKNKRDGKNLVVQKKRPLNF